MDRLNVKVENPLPAVGTLRWLLSKELVIVLESRQDPPRRVACLATPGGTGLLTLAECRGRGAPCRATREEAWTECPVPWTDAAWILISRLAEHACELLHEPAWMAEAVSVRYEPVTPTVGALLADADVCPAARKVMYDMLAERRPEWEIPF